MPDKLPLNTIRKLLGKDALRFVEQFFSTTGEPLAVLDTGGRLIIGKLPDQDSPDFQQAQVQHNGQLVGWVIGMPGSPQPIQTACLLEYFFTREAEKKALAAEVLDRYRELHLLYRLSEKLVASLQPATIASLALSEICPIINASGGIIALHSKDGEKLSILATCERPYQLRLDLPTGETLIGRVLRQGIAELDNNLLASDYFTDMPGQIISLLCAPLRTEKGALGVILLVGEQPRQFTAGELKLLNAIAMQTAPAIEIAHLHQLELAKARLERDLHTARQVQAALLPQQMPVMPGWRVASCWQPAREVSGDFYEFLHFEDGRLGLAIADVTDKGMPAALVMTNTRSIMRAVVASSSAEDSHSPGKLLSQVNAVLSSDMPLNMFVTCLLMILEPDTGRVVYANAGHNLPYQRVADGVRELRATGLPLGLFPDVEYEDKETLLAPGESLLMYSDGLTEAHDPGGDLYGYPRLQQALAAQPDAAPLQGEHLIHFLLDSLADFTGPDWEQEDDVTMVVLDRL